ncbi:MAG: alpha/beta hydrolase, partial [Bdellovibrionia bacterium]
VTTLLKSTRLIADRRLPAELKMLQQKILVLWGKNDKLVPHYYVQELLSHLPSSEFAEHPTAGHHAMEDDPAWILEKVQNFFSQKV